LVLADTAGLERPDTTVTQSAPFDTAWIPTLFVGASFRLS
jgi:hypothetical protein